jgi:putative inorganic carbon (HCO3(-)) transporter
LRFEALIDRIQLNRSTEWRDAAIAAVVGGGALFVLLAPIPLAAIGAIAFVVAGARRPLPALATVVLSLPAISLTRSFGRFEFSTTEILILLSIAAAFVRLVVEARRTSIRGLRLRLRYLRPPIGDPIVAALAVLLVAAGLVSLTASVAPHQSLQSFRQIILEPVVFFVLVVSQAHGRRDAQVLAIVLIVAGAAISLFGIGQYITGDRIITAEAGLRRIRGFYGSPNNLALFLGRSLPITVAGALWWPGGRVLMIVAALLNAIALLLTFSVGGWVAVSIALVVVAYFHGPRALRYALGVIAIGCIGSLALALAIPRLGSHLDLRSGTNSIRIFVWQSALRMIASHPIRGIGLDNFLSYYEIGYRFPEAWEEPSLSHPHNLVLDFWLSFGLVGPILLGCLIVRLAELIHGEWLRARAVERGVYAGVAGALTDTVVHGLVDNSYFLPDLAVLFWLMFGITCVARTRDVHVRAR